MSIFDDIRQFIQTGPNGRGGINRIRKEIKSDPSQFFVLSPTAIQKNANSSRLLQKTPSNIPFSKQFQSIGRIGQNTTDPMLSGQQDIRTGIQQIQKPGMFNKASAGAKMAFGASRFLAPGVPLYQAANVIANQNNFDESFVKRGARGIMSGMSDMKPITDTKAKNIRLPVLGNVDPAEAVGGLVGFTQNPLRKGIFNVTETILPAKLFETPIKKWLAITTARGGIEGLALGLAEVPENASSEDKFKFILTQMGQDAAMELFARAGLDTAGKGIEIGRQNEIVDGVFEQLKKGTHLLNAPVKTMEINPKTGERVVVPMWRYQLGKMGVGLSTKDINELSPEDYAKVKPTKGEAEPLNLSGNSLLKSRIKDINANLPDGQKIEVPESKFGKFDEIARRVLDEYGPVKKVGKLATKKGAKLQSLDDPEILVKRNLGAGGIAEGELYGMGDIIKPYKDEMDSLGEYLIAKRQVADLAERGVEAGKDLDTSKQIVEQYGPRYEKVANQLYMYQRSILYNYLVDTGVLSEKSFKQIIDKNPNYIPYKRLFEEAGVSQLYAGKQNPVKGIKGSKREILNPFESMIENTYKAVAFGEQNRLWRSVGRIGDQFPDIGITKVKPKMAKVANVDGKNIYRPSTFNPEPNTISYFEDGKRVFYKVPPEISKVANNMGSMNNILMDIMSYPTKVIRTGATGANPEFGLFRNPLRDQFTALWNSESGYIPFVDMMRGISHYAGDDDLYRQYLLSGADQSYMTSLDQEFKSKTLNQLLKESDFSGFKGVANKIKDQKGLLGKLQEVNQFSESGTRLGEFEKALKKSGDPYQAARAAREVTVDFATIGKDTRAANRLIPFLNASVQGTIRSVKTAIKHPKRSGFLGVALGSLPATVLYIHNRMYPEYQDIEDWEKQNNWIVMTGEPGNSTPISIPKDFIMGKLFGSTTEHFLSWVDQNDPQALSKIAQTMAEFASPITNVGDALPSIAKPIIEDQFNYNSFLENQVVPDYMKGRPPEAQYDKGTREVAKIIGSRLGVSPKRIDNLLYGYFPGVFSEAINLVDFALGGKKFEDATKLPFARVFLVSGTGKIDREIKDSYFKIQDIKNQMSSVQKSTTYSESEKKAYLDSMIKEIGVETQNINRYMELQQGISPEQNTAEKAPTVPYQPKGLATKAEASSGLVIPSDPQELKMFKENIKTKIDYGEPTDKELEYYYLYDALKMPSENRYETALKEDSLWGAVGKIEKDESLPPEQQAQLIKKVADEMGLKPAHIAYQRVARQNNDKKTLFAMDRLDNAKTDKERMDILVSGRLFVDGDYILSNGVIDNLVDEGYIDYGEGETLKKMKIDPKTGKAIQTGRLKKRTRSSSSKSSKAVTGLKTYKSTPVQFGGSKLPTLRLTL